MSKDRYEDFINRQELAADADENFERTAREPFLPKFMKVFRKEDHEPRTSREGIELLSKAGTDYYGGLPYNLYRHGPAVGEHRFPRGFVDPDKKVLILYARFGGWLKKAKDSPVCSRLRWFISRTTSPSGVGSPYTMLDLWRVVEAFSSPEAATRKLCAIRARANQILSGYGVSVSNSALASVMGKFRRTGKGARLAAEITLRDLLTNHFGMQVNKKGWDVFLMARGMATAFKEEPIIRKWAGSRIEVGEFACLREALQAKSRLIVDTTDGVKLTLDPTTTVIVHGISVTEGYAIETSSRRRRRVYFNTQYLIKWGARSFHTPFYRYSPASSWCPVREGSSERAAVGQALKAWQLQDKAEEMAKREVALPGNVSLLVFKADSYRVGNCQAGTEAFMAQIGIEPSKPFVPADVLLPHITRDSRAKAVYMHARQQLKNLVAAQV